jgi:hypothetical protein
MSNSSLYVPYIESTGIKKYAYIPPKQTMTLDDWPDLGSMIALDKRVVFFMDYNANQDIYPWLLDEFPQMWETAFSPTDPSFPCTVQRPPALSDEDARQRLSLINHNLNVDTGFLGQSYLLPAVSVVNITNDVSGPGSLGETAARCVKDWNRAPNFLNVDYYNNGSFPGSVFQVAADLNHVSRGTPRSAAVALAVLTSRPGNIRPSMLRHRFISRKENNASPGRHCGHSMDAALGVHAALTPRCSTAIH